MQDLIYDAFLSHNSKDKPSVEFLATKLEDTAKLRVFLDKWNLIPGDPWQEDIEKAMDRSKSVVIFLGPSGIGGWHNEEMRSALDKRVKKKIYRVVPVLLPNAGIPEEGTIPTFLSRLTWVDFNNGLNDDNAFSRLIAGIKGIPPGRDRTNNLPEIKTMTYQESKFTAGEIDGKLFNQLRQTLLECGYVENDQKLRSVFAHPDLRPWRNKIPQANSIEDRVQAVIDFLFTQYDDYGQNALVTLLVVMGGWVDPATECHQRLFGMAESLRAIFKMKPLDEI